MPASPSDSFSANDTQIERVGGSAGDRTTMNLDDITMYSAHFGPENGATNSTRNAKNETKSQKLKEIYEEEKCEDKEPKYKAPSNK